MQKMRTIVLAGTAVVGLTGLALAAGSAMHEITVQIPGGGVAHVHYFGNTAPKIIFAQDGQTYPFAASFWTPQSPFAELDRITALMDRQMAEMAYQARLMQAQAVSPLLDATARDVPVGSSGYTFVTTMTGNGFCVRSTQITTLPNDGTPKVVTKTSGNCGSDKPDATAGQPNSDQSGLQTISYRRAQPASQPRRGI